MNLMNMTPQQRIDAGMPVIGDTLHVELRKHPLFTIADDVYDKTTFEGGGNQGIDPDTQLLNIIKIMEASPVGMILLGCGDQPYIKYNDGSWGEHELAN